MIDMICEVCAKREAVLTVPKSIMYKASGKPVLRNGVLRVCRHCFYLWAMREVGVPPGIKIKVHT